MIRINYVISEGNEELEMDFSLQEIEENDIDWLYEQFEKKYAPCCCDIGESQLYCSCGTVFDSWIIVRRELKNVK